VAHARRQVDEVAGGRDPRRTAGDAPAAAAAALQQEHIVRIDVRPDTAAGARVAHHDIVQARLRHEGELPQQGIGARVLQVDTAHEQRPVARPRPQALERSVQRLVAPAATLDDTRLDVVARRERTQVRLGEHAAEARQRAAHKEWALLPVVPQKFARRQAAEQKLIHPIDYM